MYTVILSHPNKPAYSFVIDNIDTWYIKGIKRYNSMRLIGRYYVSCGMFSDVIN